MDLGKPEEIIEVMPRTAPAEPAPTPVPETVPA